MAVEDVLRLRGALHGLTMLVSKCVNSSNVLSIGGLGHVGNAMRSRASEWWS